MTITHPHPELVDPRHWCHHCGVHVATECVGGDPPPALCPECTDLGRTVVIETREPTVPFAGYPEQFYIDPFDQS
jgi:hypothetical protein